MELGTLARGLLIGLSIAAPVGPIGVLCIRRTLAEGRLAGLATGLGATTADACYGAIAGFGLTVISQLLLAQEFWIRLLGGLFLCYLGLKTFVSAPSERAAAGGGHTWARAYTSALALTLTDPLIRRDLRRAGRWRGGRGHRHGAAARPRRATRLGALVAAPHRGGRFGAFPRHADPLAVGQSIVGSGAAGVRRGGVARDAVDAASTATAIACRRVPVGDAPPPRSRRPCADRRIPAAGRGRSCGRSGN